jgi:FkbM family methyltransferase
MSISRTFLNKLNLVTKCCNLRLCTIDETKLMEFSKYTNLLYSCAEQIGKQGAKEAFVEYALLRSKDTESSFIRAILSNCVYDNIGQLASIVSDIASNHKKTPIDDFMSFYAKNWKHSRSQWSQDMFVWYATQGKPNLRYLEIGAADGVTHSNTLALRDCLSWNGVLVEPHPEQFDVLTFTRGPSDTLYNVAAGSQDASGEINLIDAGQFSRPDYLSVDDLHSDSISQVEERVTARLQPFESIMYDAGPLDYLSLDVEGAELDLLRWIPWEKISPPTILTIEHNWRERDISAYRDFLQDLGYVDTFSEFEWLRRGDSWFIKKEYAHKNSLF